MPFQKAGTVESRQKFIEGWLREECSISELCARHGVARKTGYKWVSRFKMHGPEGLEDLPRIAKTSPHRTPEEVEAALVALKREKPRWGPKKLVKLLEERHPNLVAPASSTASDILARYGLVKACPQRSRVIRRASVLEAAKSPHDCWSADYKGNFALKNGMQCYPLTVTDNYSRKLLLCEALTGINTEPALRLMKSLFERHGLPNRIRTDNGSPFGANRGLSLSKLSLWWMRLGITHERITPGRPQQNGRHERMHRTLKDEVAAQKNFREQQKAFDAFVHEFNEERPHEAIEMKRPAELCPSPSPRQMPKHLPPLSYPAHFERRRVSNNGYFAYDNRTFWLSKVLDGEEVGLLPVTDDAVEVWAGHLPLGLLELRKGRVRFYDEDEQSDASARRC